MNRIILFTTVMLVSWQLSWAQQRIKKAERIADANTAAWLYELECVGGEGKQGTYVVKVWSYSKRADIAIDHAKKNAIHGVIFKGFGATDGVCKGQPPLAPKPGMEDEHKAFFKKFFEDGGDYMKFVQESAEGSKNDLAQQGDVVKLSGKLRVSDGGGAEYKVGVVVVVMKDNLRKHLEQAGVIRGLNSGF